MGVYDKVPGDGRELAVTDPGAVTVRAEDGRPISGVDISPFISSLPSSAAASAGKAAETTARAEPAVGAAAGGRSVNGTAVVSRLSGSCNGSGSGADDGGGGGDGGDGGGGAHADEVTTERFSTGGASGSTSQAANVVEALEAGATALLLDEDTCAGNVREASRSARAHHRLFFFLLRWSRNC